MLDISKCVFDDSWTESWCEQEYYVQTYYFAYTGDIPDGLFEAYKGREDLCHMDLNLQVYVENGRLTSVLSMAACVKTEEGYSDEDWTELRYGEDYDDVFLSQLFKGATEGPLDHLAGAYRQNLKRIQEQIKEINDELRKYC